MELDHSFRKCLDESVDKGVCAAWKQHITSGETGTAAKKLQPEWERCERDGRLELERQSIEGSYRTFAFQKLLKKWGNVQWRL